MKLNGLFNKSGAAKESHSSFNNPMYESFTAKEDKSAIMGPQTPSFRKATKYITASPREYERLVKLEQIFCELAIKEEHFVISMNAICRSFPRYLHVCSLKTCKNGLKFFQTVNTIAMEIEPVLAAHEALLQELVQLSFNWDSRQPNLSSVMLRHVDFFKLSISFITKKNDFCKTIKDLIDGDKDLALATQEFEIQVINNPEVFSHSKFDHMVYKPAPEVVRFSCAHLHQQLDLLHQNVARYHLFMMRYKENLPPELFDEIQQSDQVLEKLDKVLRSINNEIDNPESREFLARNHEAFQANNFHISYPGRRFLKEGTILRQTRKELKKRSLVLFSDYLLLCHCDYSKFWKLPLRRVNIEMDEDGIERDQWFQLYSPTKSTAIKCEDKAERDRWVNCIQAAIDELRLMQTHRLIDPQDDGDVALYSAAALWIPSHETTMCMMKECARKFTLTNRRHHCRKCGYVICDDCSGSALIPDQDYTNSRVCSACYYEMTDMILNDTMVWGSNVAKIKDTRVIFKNGTEKKLSKLFISPINERMTRGNDYSNKDKYLVVGTIWTKKGIQYARLTKDFKLYIYGAKFDPIPGEFHFLPGESYTATANDKKNRVHFKLINPDQKKTAFEFEVDNKMAEKWKIAFNQLP